MSATLDVGTGPTSKRPSGAPVGENFWIESLARSLTNTRPSDATRMSVASAPTASEPKSTGALPSVALRTIVPSALMMRYAEACLANERGEKPDAS